MNPRHDLDQPPRTLAVGDPGYRRIGESLQVFFDQEAVRKCTAYDVERGTITRHRLDGAGRSYIDPETQKIAVETLLGKVEVQWK